MFAVIRLKPEETTAIVRRLKGVGGFGALEHELRSLYYLASDDTFNIPNETVARRIVDYAYAHGSGGYQTRLRPLASILCTMLRPLPETGDLFACRDYGEQ